MYFKVFTYRKNKGIHVWGINHMNHPVDLRDPWDILIALSQMIHHFFNSQVAGVSLGQQSILKFFHPLEDFSKRIV